MKHTFLFTVVLATTLLLAARVEAGPGHDHGAAVPVVAGPALPRFSTQSDLFEAVGVLGKEELVVFIDRAATNEPVLNATVALESGNVKAVGKFEAALGEYHFDGKPFQQTAVYPITLTIKAGNDNDLLSADLDVHGEEANTVSSSALPHTLQEHPVWLGAGLLTILAAVAALILFLKNKPRVKLRNGSAA
ncbi:MAG: hypothetical protein JNL19_00155 [Burkholderiales bacterium]|nr:hypothetical protein [Burkholderiales bacterium]